MIGSWYVSEKVFDCVSNCNNSAASHTTIHLNGRCLHVSSVRSGGGEWVAQWFFKLGHQVTKLMTDAGVKMPALGKIILLMTPGVVASSPTCTTVWGWPRKAYIYYSWVIRVAALLIDTNIYGNNFQNIKIMVNKYYEFIMDIVAYFI